MNEEEYNQRKINFESEKICKESDIVTELDGKDAWGWVNLEFNLDRKLFSVHKSSV